MIFTQWDKIIDVTTIAWLTSILFHVDILDPVFDTLFITNLFVIFMKDPKNFIKTSWIDVLLAIPFLRLVKMCKFFKLMKFLKIVERVKYTRLKMFKTYFERIRAIVSLSYTHLQANTTQAPCPSGITGTPTP